MQEPYLMAIDAGTGAVRCVLTDSKGEHFISSYKEWNYQPSKIHSTGIDFNPKYFFDGERMLYWVKIRKIQKNIGYI